jgi:DNA-binding NarL/FixJ family response regulator
VIPGKDRPTPVAVTHEAAVLEAATGLRTRDRHPTQPVRVALLDDHHLVREGLRFVLENEPGIEVVGEASELDEAFDLVETTRPDVLLLDITFPDGDGVPLIRALRTRYAALRIVPVTMHRDAETVRQALHAGASGYVVKGAHATDLFQAIRAVMRGDRYVHSSVASFIVEDSLRWLQAGTLYSAREREILGLLASGQSPAGVGKLLGISTHTVRRHIANLTTKLEVRGIAGLVRYALSNGLARTASES